MVHIDGVPEIMFQMDPIDIDGWDVCTKEDVLEIDLQVYKRYG